MSLLIQRTGPLDEPWPSQLRPKIFTSCKAHIICNAAQNRPRLALSQGRETFPPYTNPASSSTDHNRAALKFASQIHIVRNSEHKFSARRKTRASLPK